jgi:hypothetical protein
MSFFSVFDKDNGLCFCDFLLIPQYNRLTAVSGDISSYAHNFEHVQAREEQDDVKDPIHDRGSESILKNQKGRVS